MLPSSHKPQKHRAGKHPASTMVSPMKWLETKFVFPPADYVQLPTNRQTGDNLLLEKLTWEDRICKWRKVLVYVLPSFLHPRTSHPERGKRSSSAWLDGLRGIAAFVVVWHHSSLLFFPWSIHYGWLDWEQSYLIQLPFIRLFVSGWPAVCIFFVVSGYAISLRTLKLSHQRQHADGYKALASSICRRHSRLFIPASAASLLSALKTYFGWFKSGPWNPSVAIPVRAPPRHGTLWGQLLDWANAALVQADPTWHNINSMDGSRYDPNQWTMPVEFEGSMVVFLVLGAFSTMKPVFRLALCAGVLIWSLHEANYAIFLFLGGMFLADLRLLVNQGPDRVPSPGWQVARKTVWLFACTLSLYILSMPELAGGQSPAPGYETLAALIPSQYWDFHRPDLFWLPISAFFLVMSIDHAPGQFLQPLFTTGFAQYLGKISFALYLIHGPLLYTLGAHLAPIFVGESINEMGWAYFVRILGVYIIFWPVAIWEADLVTRFIDEKAVLFVRWLHDAMTVS